MFNATTIDTYVRALINAREESDLIAHNCLSELHVCEAVGGKWNERTCLPVEIRVLATITFHETAEEDR